MGAERTKGYRLERVKVAPATPEGPAVYSFRANDGEYDRYQDRLSVPGWKLDAFNANPVILLNHDAGDGGFLGLGRKDVLPIGKGRAYTQGNALMVDVTFDPKDPNAQRVEQKVADGFLNAVSVRYLIPEGKYVENEKGGLDSTEQELLEISVVTIPGNQRALRLKNLSHDEKVFVEEFAALVAEKTKSFHPGASAPYEAPMTPEEIKQMQAENAALKAKAAEIANAEQVAKAQVAAEVAMQKAIDDAVAKRFEAAQKQRGVPDVMAEGHDVKIGRKVAQGTGITFARFVKAQAVAQMAVLKGAPRTTAEVLKSWGYVDMAKALSSGDFASGGSLIHPEFSTDFIETLRNQSTVRKAGARVVPMGARLEFDGQNAASTASYGGEVTEITPSNPTTKRPLILTEKKLRALSMIPNDLMKNASVSAEEFVRNDLVAVMALTEDLKFLYGSGVQGEPLGLQGQLAAGNIAAMLTLGTAGKPTVGECKRQLDYILKIMKKANAPMLDVAWFMSPSIEQAILDATGPGGEGSNVLEMEWTRSQSLRNKKGYVTNQITETSTADFFAFDMSEVIIGESQALEVEVFPNGTITNGGVVTSGISTDQTVIRAIAKHDIGLRHNVSGYNATGMTWGI